MKKLLKRTLPILITAAVTMPMVLTAAAEESWRAELEKYDAEISTYAAELGNNMDRFNFINRAYKKSLVDDENYNEFYKRCSNIVAATDPSAHFSACIRKKLSLGISSLAVLSHNGVIKPSDIQAGKENLIDIELDNDVMSSLLSYQTRNTETDFELLTNWAISHYTEKERMDMLLEDAQRATDEEKYFLIIITSKNRFYHVMTGIGVLDGDFKYDEEQYDKCVLLYDSGGYEATNTDNMIQQPTSSATCLFINSETGKNIIPAYYVDNDEYSCISIYDDDFINYNGKFNSSSEYQTEVPDINRIEIMSRIGHELTVTRRDGTEYDGMASSDKTHGYYEKGTYYCDGSKYHVKNSGGSDLFMANFTSNQLFIESKFVGTVDDITKDDMHFSFDTDGISDNQYAYTTFYVKICLEEGSYSFTPHFCYEFTGETNGDFSAEITDRGIILSGSNGVKCKLKTSDVKRDEDGMLISAEDNVYNDAVDTLESVMVVFDENNNLRYYIGDNYDTEVQKGDVNCDGVIDSRDASILLTAYVNQSNDVSLVLGDYDENGVIDARDASAVLTYYVANGND